MWWYEVDWANFRLHTAKRRAGEKAIRGDYVQEIAAFDIETSTTPDGSAAFMYVWQLAIDDMVIVGRTWSQFKSVAMRIKWELHGRKLLVFVHNLSYEGQWLSGIYDFENEEVFATDRRKLLKLSMYVGFDLRCSYRLTNLSLDALTKRYNVQHQKLSGKDFDYSIRRYPDTPLTPAELAYCTNDVLGLVEAIREIMRINDDSVYSLPLTQTGFVRREVKEAMRPHFHQLRDCWPSWPLYLLLRAAFRGGNTHASRFYAGEIMENVKSVDISSSYPSQIVNKLFPVTPFEPCRDLSVRQLDRRLEHGMALIMDVRMTGVELINPYVPIPYIPHAKCAELDGWQNDNGRVIRARSLRICLTDLDWRIIRSQYRFQTLEIIECWRSNYGLLPDGLRETTKQFFRDKTRLKGVAGQELYYAKAKELLNAIYGMSVMDPVKGEILFNNNQYDLELDQLEPEDRVERKIQLLKDAGKQPYTVYQWGVWVTAWARTALQAGIDLCGDQIVYVDTDSCKFVGDVDFSAYNADRIAESERSGGWADDPQGRRHYLGVYEDDGSYLRFCTLGAKKYAFEFQPKVRDWYTPNWDLGITISGVGKTRGAEFLKVNGGLEAFAAAGKEDGSFVFRDSGKTESHYNDVNQGKILIDGHEVDMVKNVVIRDKEYTLSVTDTYLSLMQSSSYILNKVHQHWLNCRKCP